MSGDGGCDPVINFLRSRHARVAMRESNIDYEQLPSILDIQKRSYDKFIFDSSDAASGIKSVFRNVFPIADSAGRATLDFVSCRLEEPRLDVDECIQSGATYSAVLRAVMRLIVWSTNEDGARDIKNIKEQEVYVSDLPLMTDKGTFIVNGCEYVVVSQMHRSPGVFFDHDGGKNHSAGKILYSARIIPYRGSWLDFEFDGKDLLYFRIDRKRKMLVTTLLYALDLSKGDIIDYFYDKITIFRDSGRWKIDLNLKSFVGFNLPFRLLDENDNVVVESDSRVNQRLLNKLANTGLKSEGIFYIDVDACQEDGVFFAKNIINPEDNSIIFESGDRCSSSSIKTIEVADISSFDILLVDDMCAGGYILNALNADKNSDAEESLMDIYRVMRPGEMVNPEVSRLLLHSFFFDPEKYDLSSVGRVKMNAKLGMSIDEECGILTKDDILRAVKLLIAVKDGRENVDDIDHLGNRRIRSVGELVENQFRIGLMKIGKAVIERLSTADLNVAMPHDLVHSKLLMSMIREFFSTSQLSQFMDQTNPLSEITHKRRLSALGPGGLTRERAGYEVRDVHTTHYGRICPIETPEGQNIGLINSLAIYATVDKYGFMETPYYEVKNAKRTNKVRYMSAMEEEKYNIAQSGCDLSIDTVLCRRGGNLVSVHPNEVHYMDVSPRQVVSVAASLIPYLENNDANRALMGSNMQRQAVPLLRNSVPMVGTGMEYVVARDSDAMVLAQEDGVVKWVDGKRVIVYSSDSDSLVRTYNLQKFRGSNHSTNINHIPCVRTGDIIKKGDVIADGSATKDGELSLGKNLLVAFAMMDGFNFEDSILVSESLLHRDTFTSIHITELDCAARDTRMGPEEITRDIPNVSESKLAHLDESGIVNIGMSVGPGDILVGKITPKSESPMTPEEKLLRTIFGERSSDVKDSSLYLPAGIYGTVVDVRIFSIGGLEKEERVKLVEQQKSDEFHRSRDMQTLVLCESVLQEFCDILSGANISHESFSDESGCFSEEKVKLLSRNKLKDTVEELVKIDIAGIKSIPSKVKKKFSDLSEKYKKSIASIDNRLFRNIERLSIDSDLPQGVLKIVKISLAVKSRLQPGDKMAGRHGNKGVVSRILPVADMPHLEDGTPVDIVLNPLGVPSRMNVGQILETHLGWICKKVGKKVSSLAEKVSEENIEQLSLLLKKIYTSDDAHKLIDNMTPKELILLAKGNASGISVAVPVFESPTEEMVREFAENVGVDIACTGHIISGVTGELSDRPVTIGYIYMLKLHHLVDNKMHARSVGPYSLITQQPLGGKSQSGGQRFGEMEVWALEAYGAAYTLQEMLTVKSDDVVGRVKMYESIVRGAESLECGLPESFNVLIKELMSLGLNVEFKDNFDEENIA